MKGQGLLDTGPLVAALDRADGYHRWSTKALSGFPPPLASCEAVVSEAWHLLGRARGGRDALVGLLKSGLVQIRAGLSAESEATYNLLSKYADQPMSVADACLVRMAELDPAAPIITLDRDFLVYRRGRSRLRLVAPFRAS